MNCEQVKERMYDLLDGLLAVREEAQLREHIAACSSCAADFASSENMLKAVHALGEEAVPAHFSERVMQAVVAQPISRSRNRFSSTLRITAASVAAAVLLLIIFLPRMAERQNMEIDLAKATQDHKEFDKLQGANAKNESTRKALSELKVEEQSQAASESAALADSQGTEEERPEALKPAAPGVAQSSRESGGRIDTGARQNSLQPVQILHFAFAAEHEITRQEFFAVLPQPTERDDFAKRKLDDRAAMSNTEPLPSKTKDEDSSLSRLQLTMSHEEFQFLLGRLQKIEHLQIREITVQETAAQNKEAMEYKANQVGQEKVGEEEMVPEFVELTIIIVANQEPK